MIPLALRLLGWGKIALRAAVGLVTRWPRECSIVALLCLSAWLWRGWSHERAGRKSDAVAFQQASDEARTRQAELRAAEQADYERKADAADQKHAVAVADARSSTDRFIVRNRVQPNGGQCAPVSEREAGAAQDPAPMPSTPVLVDEADVRRAAEWQAYGVACHDWALSVTK